MRFSSELSLTNLNCLRLLRRRRTNTTTASVSNCVKLLTSQSFRLISVASGFELKSIKYLQVSFENSASFEITRDVGLHECCRNGIMHSTRWQFSFRVSLQVSRCMRKSFNQNCALRKHAVSNSSRFDGISCSSMLIGAWNFQFHDCNIWLCLPHCRVFFGAAPVDCVINDCRAIDSDFHS